MSRGREDQALPGRQGGGDGFPPAGGADLPRQDSATATSGRGAISLLALDLAGVEERINRERTRCGAGPLLLDAGLVAIAEDLAAGMAERGRLTRDFGPGASLRSRLAGAGLKARLAAQNVSAGHSSVESALRGWLSVRGQRDNLIDPRLHRFGIAGAINPASRYRTYWAIVLIHPAPH